MWFVIGSDNIVVVVRLVLPSLSVKLKVLVASRLVVLVASMQVLLVANRLVESLSVKLVVLVLVPRLVLLLDRLTGAELALA